MVTIPATRVFRQDNKYSSVLIFWLRSTAFNFLYKQALRYLHINKRLITF